MNAERFVMAAGSNAIAGLHRRMDSLNKTSDKYGIITLRECVNLDRRTQKTIINGNKFEQLEDFM